MRKVLLPVALFVAIVAMLFTVWSQRADLTTPTGYHAVFLDNNLVMIGKISRLNSRFPLLEDVFYLRPGVNQETKRTVNVVVKRGGEWHGPDRTVLNREHILFIEPVATGSRLDKLMQDVRTRGNPPEAPAEVPAEKAPEPAKP
ncbi:MAG: hypothetical protein SFV18_07920 [Bryobacteraceae bacterium]|nr:hypothetical protein [Bryobacteraceae bacterium]